MKWYNIVLALVWIVCIIGIYIVRFLLAPFAAVFGIIMGGVKYVKKKHKKSVGGRPRPVKGRLRKSVKKDMVIDSDGNVMPLYEYNDKRGTRYSLDDIYGKGYEKRLSEKDRSLIKKDLEQSRTRMQVGLPDTRHKEAAAVLSGAIVRGITTAFEKMLDDNCVLVLYGARSIKGKAAILDYWKDRERRAREAVMYEKYTTFYCPYYSNAALLFRSEGYASLYALFHFENEKITSMVLTPVKLQTESLGRKESLNEIPYNVDFVRSQILKDVVVEAKPNRLPCPHCGTPSEKLDWHRVEENTGGMFGYAGDASICPHCNRVVEYTLDTRVDYDETIDKSPHWMEYINAVLKRTQTQLEYSFEELDNEYARIWGEFHDCLEKLPRDKAKVDASEVLNTLTSLSMAPGFRLGLEWASGEWRSSEYNSNFFTCAEGRYVVPILPLLITKGKVDPLKGLRVTPDACGVWQYYLLKNASRHLPAIRYGERYHCNYVMSVNDCLKIEQLEDRDLRDLTTLGIIPPSVVIEEQSSNKMVASVYCCYWNEWDGLVREQTQITVVDNEVTSAKVISTVVLHQYNCGIMF